MDETDDFQPLPLFVNHSFRSLPRETRTVTSVADMFPATRGYLRTLSPITYTPFTPFVRREEGMGLSPEFLEEFDIRQEVRTPNVSYTRDSSHLFKTKKYHLVSIHRDGVIAGSVYTYRSSDGDMHSQTYSNSELSRRNGHIPQTIVKPIISPPTATVSEPKKAESKAVQKQLDF